MTTTSDTTSTAFPPAAPEVVAAAVEGLTSRLRKKLDAAVEQYAALPVTTAGDGSVTVVCGEDTTVTLAPGPSGAITDADQATCTCLLAPRCLHRAAVLTACPVADAVAAPEPEPQQEQEQQQQVPAEPQTPAAEAPEPVPLTRAQIAAASGLLTAAASILAAGVPAAGAVPQAELLRAAHTARLAGLHRAEAAALRVVRGLRSARARHDGHRLADLTAALRELVLTTTLLAAGNGDPAVVGTARRPYRPGSALRVHGVCREPVLSATGYGGVVTHLLGEDGRWFSIADVRPGGAARAKGAGTASVSITGATLDHARLARGGLLIAGATVSPDHRLGAGKGVRATAIPGRGWASGPLGLFGRSLAATVADRLPADPGADPDAAALRAGEPVGCDLVIIGPSGDHVLARELLPDGAFGPLIRLTPAHRHPDLGHTANLRQLAGRPGLRIRVVGRLDPDRAATLSPLAVGPVPGGEATLRLPAEWQGHADLGYDRLQGAHFPPPDEPVPPPPPAGGGPDPLAGSPLWRVRRLVELAVAGGRRAVAESVRGGGCRTDTAALRRAGLRTAADLLTALGDEADRRTRDVFGRLEDADPHRFAAAWLASAVHLAAAEQELIRATWRGAADAG